MLVAGMIVLLVMGRLVDAAEFVASPPGPECDDFHYHAANFSFVTALDGTVLFDPGGCGFGKVPEVRHGEVFASPEADGEFDGLPDSLELQLALLLPGQYDVASPDTDGDGILDGDEDADGDRLSNNEELYVHQTDPAKADGDGDGVLDGVEVRLADFMKEYTAVPGLIGAFHFAGLTEPDMRDTVRIGNGILRPLNLRVVGLGYALDVLAGDDGDGILDEHERRWSSTYFNQTWDMMGRNGIYAGFVADDWAPDLGSPSGATVFGDLSFYVKGPLSLDLRATVFAHEFGHGLGLPHPTPGSEEDTVDNVMQDLPAGLSDWVLQNGADELRLTDFQLAKTRYGKLNRVLGRTLRFEDGVATPRAYQIGRVTDNGWDALGNLFGDPYDLNLVGLEGEEGEDEFRLYTTLHGPVTDDFRIALRYGFDTDNDAGSGQSFGSFSGVDTEIRVEYRASVGVDPLTFGLRFDYELFEYVDPVTPDPVFLGLEYKFAEAPPEGPVGTGVAFTASKTQLGLAATQIPVYVITEDAQGQIRDEAALVFRLDAYLDDPVLEVIAPVPAGGLAEAEAIGAGDSVSFQLSGLTPNTAFDLLVDETTVISDTTDGSGSFVGDFTVPAETAGGHHFLTAQDATGEFGFTVFAVPEPATLWLRGAALAALMGLARRRRR